MNQRKQSCTVKRALILKSFLKLIKHIKKFKQKNKKRKIKLFTKLSKQLKIQFAKLRKHIIVLKLIK